MREFTGTFLIDIIHNCIYDTLCSRYEGMDLTSVLNTFRSAAERVLPPMGFKDFFDYFSRTDERRMTRLLERVASTPMGQELLSVAKSMNVNFRLDDQMPYEQGGGYHASKRYIVLNKKLNDRVLISSLAHELRHVWQHAHMPYKFHLLDQPDEVDIMSAIIFNRYLEADAFSFTHEFVEDFEQRVGRDGILTEYELRQSQQGLNIRSLRNTNYQDKIDFYAAALGAERFNSYDYEVISNFSSYIERKVKEDKVVKLLDQDKWTSDLSQAAYAVEQLRAFDKPFMSIPAPFAYLKTVDDFCDPKRLVLTEDVKKQAAIAQKMFAYFFLQSDVTGHLQKQTEKNITAVVKI